MPELPVVAAGIQRVADARATGGERARHRRGLRTRVVIAPDEQERAQRVGRERRTERPDIVERAVVVEHRRARVGEHAAAGLEVVPRPGLQRSEHAEVVQRDVGGAVRAGREAGDHARAAVVDRRETVIDVIDDVDHVAHVGARRSVRPLGVGVRAAADPAVGVDEDHRLHPVARDEVVHPQPHVGDRHIHLRAARAAVQQVVDGVAPASWVIAGREVGEIVGLAPQRAGIEVDADQPSLVRAGDQGHRLKAAMLVVGLPVAVGAAESDHHQPERHEQRARPARAAASGHPAPLACGERATGRGSGSRPCGRRGTLSSGT